ncbi:MAG: hypothetical protein KF745_07460 [Phycisphaeraceae bacterium]|nr:hypothetical protein [Phycisphaeraceae bacterium]
MLYRAVAIILAAILLGACTPTAKTADLDLAPGQYDTAFVSTRRVLRDTQFDVDRVDARAGVITTAPKPTAGLATPWDEEQQTFDAEVDDLLNRHRRIVRVTFEPAPGAAPTDADPVDRDIQDLARTGPTVMRIRVVLLRVERPGWRPDLNGAKLNVRSVDPDLARRGLLPSYTVPIGEDRDLAKRLAYLINEDMKKPGTDQSEPLPEPEPERALSGEPTDQPPA